MNTEYQTGKCRINVRSVIATVILTSAIAMSSHAETLDEYVATCKDELDFTSIPQMDCRKENFRVEGDNRPFPVATIDGRAVESTPSFSASNDWVAHKRINNSVDAVFACRWVVHNEGESSAASGEMIVHNRRSGKTCFFELKRPGSRIEGTGAISTTNPPSPTSSSAAEYWEQPSELRDVCTSCHVAGPYIASSAIVGALAKFGLINDGHDTHAERYSAVGAEFGDTFNSTIRNEIQTRAIQYKPSIGSSSTVSTGVTAGCASACHVIGGQSRLNVQIGAGAEVLLPPIGMIIYDDIIQGGHMPPNDANSDYRWVNRDDPGSTGDWERLEDVSRDYPQFACSNPIRAEIHEVDSSTVFKVDADGITALQKLYKFNLQDGLICRDQDQPQGPGQPGCFSYSTRYKCDGTWTGWQDNSSELSIDDQSRSKFRNLCSNPSAIQGRYRAPVAEEVYVSAYGPRNRLAQFDNKGVVCKNSDQDDGKCKNYVVRFICN